MYTIRDACVGVGNIFGGGGLANGLKWGLYLHE